MTRFKANHPLIAIVYEPRSDPVKLVRRIVAHIEAKGGRSAGFIQKDRERSDRARCDMDLEELATGRRIPISEDRGPGATGCRLHEEGLNRAIVSAMETISSAPDVLVLNKFGKSETEGRGFRPLIAAALEAGVPVITPVPARNLDNWRRFAGSLATEHHLASLEGLSEVELFRRLGLAPIERIV